MKLSLCMIVRGGSDPTALSQCLESIVPFVDEVCIVETYVTGQSGCAALEKAADDACRTFDVPMAWQVWEDENGNTEHEWISDFAKARNMAQEMVTGELWCYIDSDTVLVNGAHWRDDIDKHFGDESQRIGMMRLNYQYSFDPETGRCDRDVPTKMVFRSGTTEWEWPLHEQAKVISGVWRPLEACHEDYYIRHQKTKEAHDESSDRNFWIIKNYMERGGEMHARMWISLATCQIGREEYGAALAAIQQCLSGDPCDIDRWKALSAMGGILSNMGHYDEALAAYGEMAALHPERSSPWVYIAQTLCNAERYQESLAALGRIGKYPGVPEGASVNPVFLEYSPLYTSARALSALGEWREAIQAFEKCLEVKPGLESAKEHLDALKRQVWVAEEYNAYKVVADNVPGIWKDAPAEMDILPEVARAKMPKRPKGRPPVMIWCGPPNSKPWGPSDLGSGLGGSEEAVVYLSRELVKQGFHVEVYAAPKPGESGVDEHGVVWVNHGAWKDREGILVQWRGSHLMEQATKASARYIWLHDVQHSMVPYTDSLKAAVTGVFCLSEFHAKPLVEHGWADKIIYTKNGLPPSVLGLKPGKRDKNAFVYCSAPDRGLDTLLGIWREVRYSVPEATLDVYYGFTPYYLKVMGKHPHLRALKLKVEAQLKDLEGCGVTFHGMVGHDELHEKMLTSGFWLYPTNFPEVSCITGMKMQALGCIPITSRCLESSLSETVRYDLGPEVRSGSICEDTDWLQEWVQVVVKSARASESELSVNREEMSEWAKNQYDWSKVAETWGSLFLAAGESPRKASKKSSRAKASSTAS